MHSFIHTSIHPPIYRFICSFIFRLCVHQCISQFIYIYIHPPTQKSIQPSTPVHPPTIYSFFILYCMYPLFTYSSNDSPTYPSIQIFMHKPTHPSIIQPSRPPPYFFAYLSIYPFIHLHTHALIKSSINLPTYSYIVYPVIYLPISPSAFTFTSLSTICPSISLPFKPLLFLLLIQPPSAPSTYPSFFPHCFSLSSICFPSTCQHLHYVYWVLAYTGSYEGIYQSKGCPAPESHMLKLRRKDIY